MKLVQTVVERNHYTVDEGTMGFTDYVTHYEKLNEFISKVSLTANELINDNHKILSISYPSENIAVIVSLALKPKL